MERQAATSAQQLEILKEQERLRVAPFVAGMLVDRKTYLAHTRQDDKDVDMELKYFGQTENISPNLAINVSAYIYNPDHKKFLAGTYSLDYLVGGIEQWFEFGRVHTEEDVANELKSIYGID